MIELAELKVFVMAAEENSFSRAAERLHLSQSAVSQTIQALEKTFGVKLFLRQGRSVRVNEAGQALLPLAREMLSSARLMMDTMSNLQNQVVGELALGCSTASGKYLLPSLVAAYRREYPAVKVRIHILSWDEVFTRLLDERLSLGVMSKVIEHHDVEYRPLFEDHMILIAPAGHPWAAYGRALPADLLDQPLIMREAGAGTTSVVLEGLAQHSISPDMLDVVMEVGNAEAIEMAVEEGIGVAFVSALAAARGLAAGRIRQVNVEGLELSRMIYIARSTRSPLTRAQERFWAFAQEHRPDLASQLSKTISGLKAALA